MEIVSGELKLVMIVVCENDAWLKDGRTVRCGTQGRSMPGARVSWRPAGRLVLWHWQPQGARIRWAPAESPEHAAENHTRFAGEEGRSEPCPPKSERGASASASATTHDLARAITECQRLPANANETHCTHGSSSHRTVAWTMEWSGVEWSAPNFHATSQSIDDSPLHCSPAHALDGLVAMLRFPSSHLPKIQAACRRQRICGSAYACAVDGGRVLRSNAPHRPATAASAFDSFLGGSVRELARFFFSFLAVTGRLGVGGDFAIGC